MNGKGTLEKLLIKAYDNPKYADPPIGEFQAYVNPNEITLSYES